MPGKHSGLFRLLAGLGVLILVTCSLVTVPSLREIGKVSIGEMASRLQRGGATNIEVTSTPFSLPDHLWDVEIKDGETADLRPFIPSVATLAPGILKGSGIRIHVGQAGSSYNFGLQWDTVSDDTQLEITLFDSLQRPVGYWETVSGNIDTILPGGLYKLALSSEGLLGEDFKLTAQATRTTASPRFGIPNVSGIPTIDIQMSEAMFQSWDVQRAALQKEFETQPVVDTSNFNRVLADLVTEDGRHTSQLWASGVGLWINFCPETPSFTGRIVSGPLLFGMSRFKLHSIRTQAGLLDYVAESIMYDEGLFVPRCILVRASLNGRSLGLYRLVESPKSTGFFDAVGRYPGLVIDRGELRANPDPRIGLADQKPTSLYQEYSSEFASKVDQLAFAKSLAFMSGFQSAHATTTGNFWMWRHPYLDSPEPVVHDLYVDTVQEKLLLIHTGWWLGPRLPGGGNFFEPKVFPQEGRADMLAQTPWAINYANMHLAVPQFVRAPENRELFDRYLFYASDGAFQRRFAARMQSTYEAVRPFLDDGSILGSSRGYNEASSLASQVDEVVADQFTVTQTVPVLAERSNLLISVDPPGTAPTADTRTISLYNLSPYSARLRLPDYARIADTSPATTLGDDSGSWHLSPSLLFPTVVPLSADDSQQDLNHYPLSQEVAQRFLVLERLRFRSQPDASTTLVPFIDVSIPASRFTDFISTLEKTSIVNLAGTYALPASRNMLVSKLPYQSRQTPRAGNSEPSPPEVVILPLSLEPVGSRQRLSLLVSNFSPRDVSLDLATLRWIDPALDGDVPYSIHAIWKLGKKPSQSESSRVTLGAASSQTGSSSPMIWTGALQGLLNGAADEAMPNCVLVEFDLEGTHPWTHTDANGLAQSASADGVQRTVVIHEPYDVYLPIKRPDTSKILGYQRPPASATVSVSSIHTSHTKDCLIDRDINTFWHVKHPPESSVHWIALDFGEPVTVEGLAILPRDGNIQFWDQDHAIFQGSNDPDGEVGWVGIAKLFTDKAVLSLKGWDWLRYNFTDTTTYQYYRILIDDPTFLSIAEVKFQVKEWGGKLFTPAELIEQEVIELGSTSDGSPKTIRFKNKNMVITSMITIPSGYVLELDPGSNLKFTHNAGILSYSPIHAIGTAEEPIILSPAEGSTGWAGIGVINAPGVSEFRHVVMDKATSYVGGETQFTGGLAFIGSPRIKPKVIISDMELLNFSSVNVVHLIDANFEVTRLTMRNCFDDGFDANWSTGTLADSTFLQSGNDAIDLSRVLITITNCFIDGAGDKGISVGEGSVVDVTGVYMTDCVSGLVVKDESVVSMSDSELVDNQYGIVVFIATPIYTYPQLTLENNRFERNKTNIHEESPSSWRKVFP
ncbi:right-handed parallel beta-helix repeat-containing protein [Chloroflexota bacterium]